MLEQLADSLHTSIEVMDAINAISTENRSVMDIWDDPTPEEQMRVLEMVTGDELFWGDMPLSYLAATFNRPSS